MNYTSGHSVNKTVFVRVLDKPTIINIETDGVTKPKSRGRNKHPSPTDSIGRAVVMSATGDDGEEYEKCFVRIAGMTCGSCVANVEKNLMKVEGGCIHSLSAVLLLFSRHN